MSTARLVSTLLTAGMAVATVQASADQTPYVIVVNPGNMQTLLTKEELSDLLLKRKAQWNDGTPVEPVDLPPSSRLRQSLSEEVHGRSAENIASFWKQQIFSGKGVPPVEVADEAAVVSYVREHAGGIGYVSPSTSLQGVKAIGVILPPVRISYVPPVYPPLAQRMRYQGAVVLRLTVSPQGDVTNVEVVEGQPHGLTNEAVRAAKQWRFRPASRGGEAIEATVDVTVQFNL